MISLQFILTLAVISTVLLIVLLPILAFSIYDLNAPYMLTKVVGIALLVLIIFWIIFGTFLALNVIWNWGLVK